MSHACDNFLGERRLTRGPRLIVKVPGESSAPCNTTRTRTDVLGRWL